MVLSARYRHVFSPMFEKVARFVAVHPNVITLFSILFAIIGAYYYANALWLWGSIAAAIAALLDAVDGAVARYWKKESKWGAYLDAITDRYVEGIILFGIGYGSGLWPLVYAIMFASIMISYAKARAAMETKVDNINWPDLFERAERLIFLVIGVPIFAYLNRYHSNALFYFLLFFAVVLNVIGAPQRILRVRKRLTGAEKRVAVRKKKPLRRKKR